MPVTLLKDNQLDLSNIPQREDIQLLQGNPHLIPTKRIKVNTLVYLNGVLMRKGPQNDYVIIVNDNKQYEILFLHRPESAELVSLITF